MNDIVFLYDIQFDKYYFDTHRHTCQLPTNEGICGCSINLFKQRHFYSPILSALKKNNEGIDIIFCVANKPSFPFGP